MKTSNSPVIIPPVTLMVWEHHLTVLTRALEAYTPTDEVEEILRRETLDILETAAAER
jgi:hypothetical protein